MDLFIIRHAWAEERDSETWPDDAQRPLTKKGRGRMAEMARVLVERGVRPAVIATSPMVRCVQTAEILVREIGAAEVIERDELLPGGDAEDLLRWTAEQAERHEQIAWVGHAPDVGRLAAAAIGGDEDTIDFSKGAVAAVRFEGAVHGGAGLLRWLVTAKLLGL